MAVLTIEDFTGNTQVGSFSREHYERFKQFIQPDTILFFRGKLNANDTMGGGGGAGNGNGNGNAARPEGEDAGRPPSIAIMPDEIMTVEAAAERFVSDVTLLLDENEVLPAINGKNGAHALQMGTGMATATSRPRPTAAD